MKSNVLLLVPPIEVGRDEGNTLPPLGILYLASSLEKAGFHVNVVDWRVKDYSMDDVVSMVKSEMPFLIGISIMTPHVPITLDFAKLVKEECPGVRICLGGPHINGTKGEVLEYTNDVDYLICGEGEETIVELARAIPDGDVSKIKGLIYRDSRGRIKTNQARPFIEDLDSIPFPDHKLIDLSDYSIFSGSKKRVGSIIMTRGCPFNCAFCDVHTTMGRRLRMRSVANTVDEVGELNKKFGIDEIFIKDSTFTVRRDWVIDFCNEIKKRKIRIEWLCNTRVDCVDGPLLKTMKEAGCKQIAYGIESGSQKILDNIHKNITLDQVRRAFRLTKKAGITTQGFFMIGNPGETPETVRKTIAFAKELSPDFANFAPTMAYPNTDIYFWAVKTGAIKDPHWYMKRTSQFMHLFFSDGQLNLKELPPAEQRKWVKRAYKQYYFRPRFIVQTLMRVSNPTEMKKFMSAAWRIIMSSTG